MTGPRRLPTWTVPDGVFESLTTWGPASRPRCASSSAQSSDEWRRGAPPSTWESGCRFIGEVSSSRLGDAEDLVREVARGHADNDLLALLLPEQRAPDRTLVGDAALGGLR